MPSDPGSATLSLKTRHDVLGLRFTIGDYTFQPLNIVFEQFHAPIPMHRHSDGCYELHYIPSGKGTVTIGQVRYPLGAGSLFVTGPNVDHEQQIDPTDPMAEYCIFLYVTRSQNRNAVDTDLALRFIDTDVWIGEDQQDLLPLLRRLFLELNEKQFGYRVAAQGLIRQWVVCMVRNYAAGGALSAGSSLPQTASEHNALILDECFLYEYSSITLEQLSARLSLSIRQTERLIQDQYHQTFRQKRAAARMHAATALLVSTRLSLTEIAERLGFSSAEHFSAAFSKYYQISPGKYRRQCLTQTEASPR